MPPTLAPTETQPSELAFTPTTKPLPICTVATGYTDGTVNIRSGPGMEYPVVDYASEGEELVISATSPSGWVKVATKRLTEGYFYAKEWCK